MDLLTPIVRIEDWPKVVADQRQPGESMQPQKLHDEPQQVASIIGRQNVSYDPIWAATERVYPKWQPVRCNSARRALLLASSATQHRTKTFLVHRRGRLVCLKFVPEVELEEPAPVSREVGVIG
jgi:hypothetical protein